MYLIQHSRKVKRKLIICITIKINIEDFIHSFLIYGYTILKQQIYTKEITDKKKLSKKNRKNLFLISFKVDINSSFNFESSLLNLINILFIFSSSIEKQPIKYDIIMLTHEV